MSRPFKPQGMPSLIPYITVPNATEAIAFYQEVFGFSLSSEPSKKDKEIIHAEMQLGEAHIMFAPEGAWGTDRQAPNHSQKPSPIGLYIYVPDVDKHFKHAQEKGAEVLDEPQETFWGDRMSRLKDPFGYEWSFATNIKDFDPAASPFKS